MSTSISREETLQHCYSLSNLVSSKLKSEQNSIYVSCSLAAKQCHCTNINNCVYFKPSTQEKKGRAGGGLAKKLSWRWLFYCTQARRRNPWIFIGLAIQKDGTVRGRTWKQSPTDFKSCGGWAALQDESSLQTNILTITVYIFMHSPSVCQNRQGREGGEGGEGGVLNGSKRTSHLEASSPGTKSHRHKLAHN